MSNVVLLSGSPSPASRSAALLELARRHFAAAGLVTHAFGLRDFPAEDLIFGRYESPAFKPLADRVAGASVVVIATPVYKAAYSGGLKTILDILPLHALRGKTVLVLATAGSPGHQLVLDYALKPVLAALGATDLRQGVYVVDKQAKVTATGEVEFLDDELRHRFNEALQQVTPSVLNPALAL